MKSVSLHQIRHTVFFIDTRWLSFVRSQPKYISMLNTRKKRETTHTHTHTKGKCQIKGNSVLIVVLAHVLFMSHILSWICFVFILFFFLSWVDHSLSHEFSNRTKGRRVLVRVNDDCILKCSVFNSRRGFSLCRTSNHSEIKYSDDDKISQTLRYIIASGHEMWFILFHSYPTLSLWP